MLAVAVPAAVAYATVTLRPLAGVRVTLNAALPDTLPSTTDTSPIASWGGGSLSRIVPTPRASAIPAFVGALRFTKNVSSASSARSPITLTATVCDVTPGAKVSVPELVV